MAERVSFVFKGRLRPLAFTEFAQHRAGRLDLRLEMGEADEAVVKLAVTGAGDLVDAFEMACSLGPLDCIVLDVDRYPPA